MHTTGGYMTGVTLTAIRAFMKWGEQYPQKHDLSNLRLLGSVGKPINPEAVFPAILDDKGQPVDTHHGGYLVITRPWPSMTRGLWGDPERFVQTYWSKYDGIYFTGDGARQDEDGYFWLLGRQDYAPGVAFVQKRGLALIKALTPR